MQGSAVTSKERAGHKNSALRPAALRCDLAARPGLTTPAASAAPPCPAPQDPAWRYDIMPEIIDGKNVRRWCGAARRWWWWLGVAGAAQAGCFWLPGGGGGREPCSRPCLRCCVHAPQVLDFVDPDIDARLEALEREEEALAAAAAQAVSTMLACWLVAMC